MKVIDFIFYYTAKFIAVSFMRIFYKMEVNNAPKLSEDRGVLFVGNHSSWLDTLILSYAINHRVWFVTGDFILDVPIMRNIVKHLCILPMRRNHGKEGINLAINKLKEKRPVCIFPEGEITPTGEMLRFRNGVAIIQRAANAPVIPFYMAGASEAWSIVQPKFKLFKKISITFGEPFYPQEGKDNEVAQEIQNRVIELK